MALRLPMTFLESILSCSLGMMSSLIAYCDCVLSIQGYPLRRAERTVRRHRSAARFRSWASWPDGGTVRAELPGADPTDVLRLDRRQLLELRAEGVGQARITCCSPRYRRIQTRC